MRMAINGMPDISQRKRLWTLPRAYLIAKTAKIVTIVKIAQTATTA